MNHATRTRRPAAAASPRPRRAAVGPARRRHASNFSDAVMAAYIHELSVGSRPARPGRVA